MPKVSAAAHTGPCSTTVATTGLRFKGQLTGPNRSRHSLATRGASKHDMDGHGALARVHGTPAAQPADSFA